MRVDKHVQEPCNSNDIRRYDVKEGYNYKEVKHYFNKERVTQNMKLD